MTRLDAGAIGNAVVSQRAYTEASRFAAYLAVTDTLKEAAWLARISYRTARRHARRLREAQ